MGKLHIATLVIVFAFEQARYNHILHFCYRGLVYNLTVLVAGINTYSIKVYKTKKIL